MNEPNDPHARTWMAFRSVLKTLPPTTRVVFLMHVVFGASCEEIERLTGVPRETCPLHLEAARRRMRDVARRNNDPTQDPIR
jgi:DNA-directed RNA polymerase specialized sigma24 family protein